MGKGKEALALHSAAAAAAAVIVVLVVAARPPPLELLLLLVVVTLRSVGVTRVANCGEELLLLLLACCCPPLAAVGGDVPARALRSEADAKSLVLLPLTLGLGRPPPAAPAAAPPKKRCCEDEAGDAKTSTVPVAPIIAVVGVPCGGGWKRLVAWGAEAPVTQLPNETPLGVAWTAPPPPLLIAGVARPLRSVLAPRSPPSERWLEASMLSLRAAMRLWRGWSPPAPAKEGSGLALPLSETGLLEVCVLNTTKCDGDEEAFAALLTGRCWCLCWLPPSGRGVSAALPLRAVAKGGRAPPRRLAPIMRAASPSLLSVRGVLVLPLVFALRLCCVFAAAPPMAAASAEGRGRALLLFDDGGCCCCCCC